jgi:hypothetical protein
MFFSTLKKTSSKQARANGKLQKQKFSGVKSQVRLPRAGCYLFAHGGFRNEVCTGVLQAPKRTGGTLSSC